MFFSTELLSKHDSGFGLLWFVIFTSILAPLLGVLNLIPRLAATLGSRSTFKKLPKRSIMTADISALCDLITQPDEPLVLRLSSNLMVGVAR
jgi:meiotic recombination protein REC8